MRIADVIGTVTLSRQHESLTGARWILGVPLNAEGIAGEEAGRGEPLVIFDELSAGDGQLIGFTEGAEASNPFHPDEKPIDAYNAALLDTIHLGQTKSGGE